MSKLDQLPEITDYMLSGLQADESLKFRIYQKAADSADEKSHKASRLPLAALCAISAVMITVFVILGSLTLRNGAVPSAQQNISASQEPTSSHMQTLNAGGQLDESPMADREEEKNAPEEDSEEESSEESEADESETETSEMPVT